MSDIFRSEHVIRDRARPLSQSLAALFHENTKLRRRLHAGPSQDSPYTVIELEAMACAYKRYRLHPHVALPALQRTLDSSLADAIAARRTRRDFGPSEIDLHELAALLQWSYGITGHIRTPGGGVQQLRATPSAGALYPAELYLGVRSVRGLDPGVYHYEVPDHALARLRAGDPSAPLLSVCCGQEYANQAAVVVLISAVLPRTMRKYGDRGYRYALLDIGHLAQNLCLASTAMGLSIVTTCGFYDEEAADLLGVDGREEVVLYAAFVGRPGD